MTNTASAPQVTKLAQALEVGDHFTLKVRGLDNDLRVTETSVRADGRIAVTTNDLGALRHIAFEADVLVTLV